MKTFESVSQMTQARLTAGQLIETKSYYGSSADDTKGAARYKVLTPAEYGGTPDGFVDHALANGNIAVLQISEPTSLLQAGGVGDGVTDNVPFFDALQSRVSTIVLPSLTGSEVYHFASVPTIGSNLNTLLLREGIISGVTAQQINGIQLDQGSVVSGGSVYVDELRTNGSRIEVVAGTLSQNPSNRTQWDWIKDAAHEPVGVDDTVPAVAAGGGLTIPFLKTYSRIISFVCGPDETFANRDGITVGASVGLDNAVLRASARIHGTANVYYDGANWQVAAGTGQDLNFVVSGAGNNLVLNHDYCPGIGINVNAYTVGGAVNPFTPVVRSVQNDSVNLGFQDPAAGTLYTLAAFDTRMAFTVNKLYNEGILLDGTGGSDTLALDGGNFWFIGLFEV